MAHHHDNLGVLCKYAQNQSLGAGILWSTRGYFHISWNYLYILVTWHPPKNDWVNLNSFVVCCPFKLTLDVRAMECKSVCWVYRKHVTHCPCGFCLNLFVALDDCIIGCTLANQLQSLCQHHLFLCPSWKLGDEHISILLLAHHCSILEEWLF
jgi:hypothetical protein